MKNLFSLGNLYVSDFIKLSENPHHEKEPLNLILDETIGIQNLILLQIRIKCMVNIGTDQASILR